MQQKARKTSPPLLPSTILFRETLIHQLEKALILPLQQHTAPCKLILLRAPAGYGKTTLLADFARRIQLPVRWYFLEREDADFPVFLETLTGLLSQVFPALKQALDPTLLEKLDEAITSEHSQQAEQALAQYFMALEQHLLPDPCLLCLCNYQEVNESQALQVFMNALLKRMPSRLLLAIESRAVPQLEFAPLLARRQVLGLSSQALRFSPQEIQALASLQGQPSLTEGEAEQLANTFEGWIAGIVLNTPLWNRADSSCVHVSSPGAREAPAWFTGQHELFAYLKQDVFAREEEKLAFLQETSILERLLVGHCNHLLQMDHAANILNAIERQGLFLSRVDSYTQQPDPVYTLHPAVRQVLYEEFCRTEPERVRFLHRRAARLFHRAGEVEQALTHACASQEYVLLANLLLELISSEQDEQVPRLDLACWLDLLPGRVLEQNPRLLVQRALIHLTNYEHQQALSLLQQAHQLVTTRSEFMVDGETMPSLLASIMIARSQLLFQEANYRQAQQLCEEALALLPVDEKHLRIPALLRLGICKTSLGEHTEGIALLHEALHSSGLTTMTLQTAYIHSCLANSYTLLCNYALAEHHRFRSIAIYERLQHKQGMIQNKIWLAILKRNKGAFDEAEQLLQESLCLARQEDFQSGQAYTLFNLGAHYVDTAALPQALSALEESLQLARQLSDKRLADQCLCELAMAYLLAGDHETARLLLAQTLVAQTKQPGYESLFYHLVSNTLLLYQQELEEAAKGFQALESQAQHAHLRRMQIECLIRLACCHHQLGHCEPMEAALERVVELVSKGYFEHIPLIEFRRFPDFWRVVQALPERACLSAWREVAHANASKEGQVLQGSGGRVQRQQVSLAGAGEPPKVRLHIQAFGEPLVHRDDVPITRWHVARAMELFFFLLNYQRPIHKELLVELLWADDETYVDQTFRSALHYARKAIGTACITSRAGVYMLDLASVYSDDVWYDVAQFEQHHEFAKQALKAGQDEQAERHFEEMVHLYQGDYLQSFYSNWCLTRRDELRRWYLDARRQLAHLAWNKEQWEYSLAHWQHILALDSYAEEAHFGVMRCYVRLGKRNLALRQYQRCADVFKSDLATTPGPALQKFYQQLTAPRS